MSFATLIALIPVLAPEIENAINGVKDLINAKGNPGKTKEAFTKLAPAAKAIAPTLSAGGGQNLTLNLTPGTYNITLTVESGSGATKA
jgi:hypothetical protein